MFNLETIRDLHVVKKVEEIIGKWFSIDLLFVDEYGKIQYSDLEKRGAYYGYLLKQLHQHSKGIELFQEDIEKAIYHLKSTGDKSMDFHTFLPYVKAIIAEYELEGGNFGYIVGFAYTNGLFTNEDSEAAVKKLISIGFLKEEAELAIRKISRLEIIQGEYLQELIKLYAEEIKTYHMEIKKREERISDLNSEVSNRYRYHQMIGKSQKMQEIYKLLEKLSSSESTILIQGENGTGKELVAKAIHYNSFRKDKMFVAQNCSAFNDNLLDSELFGHVKGSFTGAHKDKKGLFEMADGGTLFLDEIGDTSLTMQVKLLRVLQEGTFLPVGATSPKKVNVRVIAATNKPLKDMIAKGEFREDLYYRINVININLPSLRDRKDDIPLLMEHFMEKKCKEKNLEVKSYSKKCLEKMMDYVWPGNIRELENEVERLVVLAGDEKVITPDMLSGRILEKVGGISNSGNGQIQGVNLNGTMKDALEELEALMIKEGLKRCNFNKSKLAKELDISRASLIMKVEKYGLDKRFKKVAA